jgi:hypothetical protein
METNSADLDKLAKIIGLDPNKLSEAAEKLSKVASPTPPCAPPRQMAPWPYLPVALTTG